MKRNENKYRTVDTLPAGAMSVPAYAKSINCLPQNIYNMVKRNTATFEVVIFQGFNFVIVPE